ncbi:hypothetical protein ACFL1D_02625 [Candidatus Omnitrophota bacterium]
MAEKGPLTPERELLKLIESPSTGLKVTSGRARRNFSGLFSLSAIKARLSFFQAQFQGGFDFQRLVQHLEIKVINRSLEAFISVLIIYLVANFTISMINLNKSSSLTVEINKIAASSKLPEASLIKAGSYYLSKARARDIFKMGLTSVAELSESTEMPISKMLQASQNLQLVGISWSKDPDVIIEDTKVDRAYFLKRGQKINDLTVKAIFKDKVVLSYNEEEIELK